MTLRLLPQPCAYSSSRSRRGGAVDDGSPRGVSSVPSLKKKCVAYSTY